MTGYESFPVQTEFRSTFLRELEVRQALAELALKGGQMNIEEIEIEVELKDEM